MTRPRLAVTVGDPRGIGPEIVRAARADARVRAAADLYVIEPRASGDGHALEFNRHGLAGQRRNEAAILPALRGESDTVLRSARSRAHVR